MGPSCVRQRTLPLNASKAMTSPVSTSGDPAELQGGRFRNDWKTSLPSTAGLDAAQRPDA